MGTSPLVTLTDIDTPTLRFWVEESDLSNVAVGHPVEITLEALPDHTFKGQIVRVDPTPVTVDSTPAIQVWASVDLTSQPVQLLPGMTADVEVTTREATNVLMVPVQVLRELSPANILSLWSKLTGRWRCTRWRWA